MNPDLRCWGVKYEIEGQMDAPHLKESLCGAAFVSEVLVGVGLAPPFRVSDGKEEGQWEELQQGGGHGYCDD